MGETTKIAWTDHTFNCWWGCQRVSLGCENCYAESFAKRYGTAWGPSADRRFFPDKHWNEPRKWNRLAEAARVRKRVFCASMADVFEARSDLDSQRERLWKLISETPWLDWLLLTKRPQNIKLMLPDGLDRKNIWLGTTAENQENADKRIPLLLSNRAAKLFVSYEPALGPVDFSPWLEEGRQPPGEPRTGNLFGTTTSCSPSSEGGTHGSERDTQRDGEVERVGSQRDSTSALSGREASTDRRGVRDLRQDGFEDRTRRPLGISWLIIGGESGPKARPFDLAWGRSTIAQCKAANVPVFFKQAGALPIDSERYLGTFAPEDKRSIAAAKALGCDDNPPNLVLLWHPKGGDLSELPPEFNVREFPNQRTVR